ncbi:hypothetical protein EUGRSUZ_A01859 [Eucalyptus grandis]|uniref:Uncharacterized protein n=2 Tax=Eucalyptus grandis TaxID=71139 RepID=A0ACC3M5M3_EUCGR|nr:hypothetical protein EUGRSUZ_A01859 [Eucalyptus grandis]
MTLFRAEHAPSNLRISIDSNVILFHKHSIDQKLICCQLSEFVAPVNQTWSVRIQLRKKDSNSFFQTFPTNPHASACTKDCLS